MLKLSSLVFTITLIACPLFANSQQQPAEPLHPDPAAVETVKRALAFINSDRASNDSVKRSAREYVIKDWLNDRAIAAAEREDNLNAALDCWYANGRDWHKIPVDVWSKLRDADKGRIKLGIDPELSYSVAALARTPQRQ